jgi:hypothetical protein
MSAQQSQFSRLQKKQLVFIAEKLVDEDFPIGNPYGDNFDDAYQILKTISKYFSIEAVQEDIEFFAKFLEINDEIISDLFANNKEQMKNKELIEQLEIPVAKNYNLNYEADGSCTYIEYFSQEFDSYDEDWVRDSAEQQRQDGNWDMWDGRERRPTDYENFEMNDFNYGDVYEIDENPIRESLLSKLVLENTSNVINSLDRTTLIKLRNLINQKLSF